MRLIRTRASFVVVIYATLLLGAVPTTGGCGSQTQVAGRSTATLTTPGVRALQVKEAVKYLDIIRDTAIDAEATQVLPLATTEKVVRWHKALVQALDQTPQGWAAVALKGLDSLQGLLSSSERAVLDPYILSARIIYQAVVS